MRSRRKDRIRRIAVAIAVVALLGVTLALAAPDQADGMTPTSTSTAASVLSGGQGK